MTTAAVKAFQFPKTFGTQAPVPRLNPATDFQKTIICVIESDDAAQHRLRSVKNEMPASPSHPLTSQAKLKNSSLRHQLVQAPKGRTRPNSPCHTEQLDRCTQGKQLTETIPDILARIVARKREELLAHPISFAELERQTESRVAVHLNGRRSFAGALRARHPAIIAEIKKASPSKGLLSHDFNPAKTAAVYEQGGAAAISVLTDRDFFHGSPNDLISARAAVGLPVLRKDFTIDSVNVLEAAAYGADAILLIAAILTEREMRDFRELAARYGMAALVEVHDAEELRPALDSGAEIVGVNNRNLKTFEVKLETSLELAARIPAGIIKVSESGIHDSGDVHRLSDAGYSAFLVGEHLMKSGDPAAALRSLCS